MQNPQTRDQEANIKTKIKDDIYLKSMWSKKVNQPPKFHHKKAISSSEFEFNLKPELQSPASDLLVLLIYNSTVNMREVMYLSLMQRV